jgi:hypothetical protein
MAGAVAFVFGLCALSFAAGCVVTAVMLRPSTPEQEAVQPPTEPAAPEEHLEVRVLDEDLSPKPIHRNPVVGRPVPASLQPDSSFTGVVEFDPRPEVVEPEVVEEVDDLADEVPELRPEPQVDAVEADPAAGTEAPVVSPAVSKEAVRFFVAYAARQGAEPEQDAPEHQESKLELVSQPSPADDERASEPEPETLFVSCSGLVTEPEADPAPVLEQVEAPAPVEAPESVDAPALVPEAVEAPAPELREAVVPEQGVSPEPELVIAHQIPTPDTEFRKRYLRTFEAARRRSSH